LVVVVTVGTAGTV
jgi:hypothetical protein